MTLALLLKHTARKSFKTSLFMGSYIVSSPHWQRGQGRASQKFRDKPTASIREIELRNFQNISRFSRSPEYQILAGLLDKAHALLWLFRACRDRRRHFDRVLLLFQKVAARAVFASNATLTFATIALLLAGAQIMCMGIRIGNIVTHILRIPEEASLRHEATECPRWASGLNTTWQEP